MEKSLFIIGVILVIIGVLFLFISNFDFSTQESKETKDSEKESKGENKIESGFFVGGMIGPIPIGFSNREELFYVGLTIMVVMTLIMILFSRNIVN